MTRAIRSTCCCSLIALLSFVGCGTDKRDDDATDTAADTTVNERDTAADTIVDGRDSSSDDVSTGHDADASVDDTGTDTFPNDTGGDTDGGSTSTPTQWLNQFGASGLDSATSVAVDTKAEAAGAVYVGGNTSGSLDGQTFGGISDGFVAKYDSAGELGWVRLLGTPQPDEVSTVSADQSGIFVAGSTTGNLGDGTNQGGVDAFVGRYDTEGNRQWLRMLGTSGTDSNEAISASAVDAMGNLYVAGHTEGDLEGETNNGQRDGFVGKFNASGSLDWIRLIGGPGFDDASAVAVDNTGSVYVGGSGEETIAGEPSEGRLDGFLAKFSASGERKWVQLVGTSESESLDAISSVGGALYVVGGTTGDLGGKTNSGSWDTYLAKYDTSGTRKWVQLVGSSQLDTPKTVAVKGAMDQTNTKIAVGGKTSGDLSGEPNSGDSDAFVVTFDGSGRLTSTRLLGSPEADWATGLAVDGAGTIFVSGMTDGLLNGMQSHGMGDAYVGRLE